MQVRLGDAVAHWVKHNFQDLPLLDKYWDKYFPADDAFCLCAKLDLSTSKTQEVGDHKGQPKAEDPSELTEEAAKHLVARDENAGQLAEWRAH